MTIGDRIKEIRLALNKTQQSFGDAIGIKRNTVATYEMNRSQPSDRTIADICREFNVNEKWLRTGEGEMFNHKTRNESLTEFFSDVLSDGDSIKAQLLSIMAKLSTEQWELLDDIAHKLYDETKNQKNKPGD